MTEFIKAGSYVRHIPTGEMWYILGVNKVTGKVCTAGWPQTIANLGDCVLVEEGDGITKEELEYRDKEYGANWDRDGR